MPRKVFVSGEILTASDVNTQLMDQSVMVFDDATARTTAIPTPVEGMVTYLKDEDEVTVFDGSAFKAVGPGKILQVVSANKTDTFTTTSTTFQDVTGLTLSITPSSATSKVLLMATVQMGGVATVSAGILIRFSGGNSSVVAATAGNRLSAFYGSSAVEPSQRTTNSRLTFSTAPILLDSPNTTSAITYFVQLRSSDGGSVFINRTGTEEDSNQFIRSVSTITAMEVAG